MSGFLAALPGAAAQGLIWGIMAIGVYITFRVLDVADLTVDGSMGTGGANAEVYISSLEKRLLGVSNAIGSHSPLEDMARCAD